MSAAARVEVAEPAGARALAAPLSVGGIGATIVVPGAEDGEQCRFDHASDGWSVQPAADGRVRINSELLGNTSRELRAGDVLAVGDALLTVVALETTRLNLLVRHLAGNETVAPLKPPPTRNERDEEGDVDILAIDNAGALAARSAARDAAVAATVDVRPRSRWLWWAAAAGAVLALVLGLLAQLQRVPLDLMPREARVHLTDSFFSWQSGATLFALPGNRRLRAEVAGYEPLQRDIVVRRAANETQLLRLVKLPGLVTLDTGGVPAEIAVDGAVVGRAPGPLKVRPGARTFTARAERYLDAVGKLDVEGGGVRQTLKLPLRSAWGRLQVESSTVGATAAADEQAARATPAVFELPAGVHRVRIAAADAKTWESTAIVIAGQTTKLGPILLGAPDAVLSVKSSPAGAEVTVSGVFKGRTPLSVPLPPGTSYDIAISRPGYATWSRNVVAESGAKLSLTADLTPVLVALTVAGEPADAELLVDGSPRGKAAQTVKLTATDHAIEIRKAGLQVFATRVDLAAGVARTLDFRLVPEGRAADWQPPAERVSGKLAGALRLIAPTSFQMGSERREQGRRPNEQLRRVTFARAFYIGVREVTNGEFRRYKAEHQSGFIGKQSIDLDNQAVSSVSFEDAALYCNWLSKQEGLPEAYESKGGRMTLKQPVNNGYRLPTEAEWEYAARHTPQGLRRFEWGNALPWPNGVANLAGAETGNAGEAQLADYRDDYSAVAPVGRFAPNSLGLYDMTGNVAEWVNDRYASFVADSGASDPLGPDSGRANVVRGASWRTATVSGLRLASRDSSETARDDLGFRIARYAE